jgi:hypothetical protein
MGAQEEPPAPEQQPVLWMPEGYRLLSVDERSALPPEEWKEIGTRNTALLKETIAAMTPEERQQTAADLAAYGQGRELPQYVRQYITIVQMLMLSMSVKEKTASDDAADQKRFEDLLRAQEASGGFPSDREAVVKESQAIEEQIARGDPRELYLKILRPLRARPWNEDARVVFRKIVRGDSYDRPRKTTLYEAAIVFIQARRKENPSQGAWDSLEAFLRLSMRGEIAKAKVLFASAIAKDANETESRIFPILIAASEGNVAEIDRLVPRAQKEWPAPGRLEEVLWQEIDMMPRDSQAKTKEVLGERFKKARPADWRSRAEILSASLERGAFREVDAETGSLLELPASTLPEPDRTAFRALRLRAIAGLGRCDEVLAEIPQLEASAREVYRGQGDGEGPPAARTATDVRELRAALQKGRGNLTRLKAAIADGSIENAPELADVPRAERLGEAEAMAAEIEEELKRLDALLRGGGDDAIAAAWSAEERQAWIEMRGYSSNVYYDEADPAERLGIRVRAAAGKCLLAHGRAADAARVLAPCVGSGGNYHGECGEPILEAGRELVRQSRYREAAAVYSVTAPVGNFSSRADDLYREIERGAPGTVPRFVPTPEPTPRVTVPPVRP